MSARRLQGINSSVADTTNSYRLGYLFIILCTLHFGQGSFLLYFLFVLLVFKLNTKVEAILIVNYEFITCTILCAKGFMSKQYTLWAGFLYDVYYI